MDVNGRLHDPAALSPEKRSPVSIVSEAARFQEPFWTCRVLRERPDVCKIIDTTLPFKIYVVVMENWLEEEREWIKI
jgi:hypothetical protein